MWPILFRVVRQYAPFITLPFAAVVGYIGYHVEGSISDKYTPFQKDGIKDGRSDRFISDDSLSHATEVESLRYSANVLGKNVAPSLK